MSCYSCNIKMVTGELCVESNSLLLCLQTVVRPDAQSFLYPSLCDRNNLMRINSAHTNILPLFWSPGPLPGGSCVSRIKIIRQLWWWINERECLKSWYMWTSDEITCEKDHRLQASFTTVKLRTSPHEDLSFTHRWRLRNKLQHLSVFHATNSSRFSQRWLKSSTSFCIAVLSSSGSSESFSNLSPVSRVSLTSRWCDSMSLLKSWETNHRPGIFKYDQSNEIYWLIFCYKAF